MFNVSLTEENKRKLLTPYDPNKHYASSRPSLSPKRLTKLAGHKTEAEKLRQDALENLHIDPLTYTLNKGKKTVRYHRSLFSLSTTSSSAEQFEQEILEEQISDQEISLQPKHPGQSTSEKQYPSCEVFEYVYQKFYENNCQNF